MKKQKTPIEWGIVHFKEYPRLDKIRLPRNFSKSVMSLEIIIKKRKSRREFSENPLSLRELSKLLYYSCGITHRNKDINMTRRAYPSGGARYPLEIYLLVLKGGEIKAGLYHYNVKHHILEILLEDVNYKYLRYLYQHDFVKRASCLIIITSIPARTVIKYQQWQRFILLEAGHIGQNVYLVSEAMKLGCCAIGGWNETNMNELLDIDGKYEYIVHMIAVGKK